MFAVEYPMLSIFLSSFYFVALIFWIVLVVHIVQDIVRSHDLSGVAKALWVLLLLVLPLLGCLIYLIARGGSMHERHVAVARNQRNDFEEYIRHIASTKE